MTIINNKQYGQIGSAYIPNPEYLDAEKKAAEIAKKYGAGSYEHILALQYAISKMAD